MKKISKEEKEELVVCTSNALLFLGEDDEKPCFTDIPHKIKRFNTEEEAKEYFNSIGKNILYVFHSKWSDEDIKSFMPLKIMGFDKFKCTWIDNHMEIAKEL